MIPVDLDDIEATARAATLGPWEAWSSIYEGMKAAVVSPGQDPLRTVCEVRSHYGDAAYIALMNPQTALDLVARVRELEGALTDMRAGWRYIRMVHGDLYGVGWDRCEASATKALGEAP